MESFGCWYKLEDNQSIKSPDFDLHVNFWFLDDILKSKVKMPYLDIGIKIENYKELTNIVFSFPFLLSINNIVDLAPMMSTKKNASLVFNEECEIETKSEYTIVQIPKKEKTDKLLLFPLKQAVEDTFELTDYENKSYITIKFDTFKKFLSTNGELGEYQKIYIRFRIKDINLQNILYFDSEPFNKSLDSAFSGTRILDFKINEKRNIDKNILARMDIQEESLVEFGMVHFLLMEPSSYDMISYAQDKMTCRELEKDSWNEYLTINLNDKSGHILAYHWKKKANDSENKIRDFSCFAKINYQKMQVKTVFAYIFVVLGLGIIGSTIVSATPLMNVFFHQPEDQYMFWNFGLDALLGCFFAFLGWFLGKSK